MSLTVSLNFEAVSANEIIYRITKREGVSVENAYDPFFLGKGTEIEWNEERFSNKERFVTLQHEHYKTIYDRKLKTPIVSYANVDFEKRKSTKLSELRTFTFDPLISSDDQYGDEFYVNDKFDKGHLTQRLSVSWGNSVDEAITAQRQADYYTNIVAQYAELNRVVWSSIEDVAQKIAKENGRTIEITGSWFDTNGSAEKIYDWNAAKTAKRRVPDAFWKCIVAANGTMRCFFVRNISTLPKSRAPEEYSLSLKTLNAMLGYKIDKNWNTPKNNKNLI